MGRFLVFLMLSIMLQSIFFVVCANPVGQSSQVAEGQLNTAEDDDDDVECSSADIQKIFEGTGLEPSLLQNATDLIMEDVDKNLDGVLDLSELAERVPPHLIKSLNCGGQIV